MPQLKSTVDLICGYLSLFSEEDGDDPCMVLGNAFNSDGVWKILKDCFSALFEIDFDALSITGGVTAPLVVPSSAPSAPALFSPNTVSHVHLRQSDIFSGVHRMARLFGAILGLRNAASFVDDCLAEAYETCRASIREKTHRVVRTRTWADGCLRRNAGLIVACREMLLGSSSVRGRGEKGDAVNRNASCQAQKDKTVNVPGNGPVNEDDFTSFTPLPSEDRLNIVYSLCVAIFPIIVNAPLWNLPTCVEAIDLHEESVTDDDDRLCDDLFHVQPNSPFDTTAQYVTTTTKTLRSKYNSFTPKEESAPVSATALKGNAYMTALLLDLIATLTADLLDPVRVQSLLPIILYPILSKASSLGNHSHVHTRATATLDRIAAMLCTDRPENTPVQWLLVSNLDYIVDGMPSSMQKQPSASFLGVVELLLSQCAIQTPVTIGDEEIPPDGRSAPPTTTVARLVKDLIRGVLVAFDTAMENHSSAGYKLIMIAVFRAAFVSLGRLLRRHGEGEDEDSPAAIGDTADFSRQEPWLDNLLAEFGRRDVLAGPSRANILEDEDDEDAKLNPEEGFAKYRAARDDLSDNDDDGDDGDSNEKRPPATTITGMKNTLVEEVRLANSVLSRCAFLLSCADLKVQVAACQVMQAGFQYLAAVAEILRKRPQLSAEFSGNPLLISVSDMWSSVVARLRDTVSRIHSAGDRLNEKDNNNRTVFFLQSLSGVISSLVELAGVDFMADRFQKDVWPILATRLRYHVTRKSREEKNGLAIFKREELPLDKRHDNPHCRHYSHQTFNVEVTAILHCLSRVFSAGGGETENGIGARRLSPLCPTVGTAILPLLYDRGSVGDAAVAVLRSLLMTDRDCLWRGLLVMSGRMIAPNPLSRGTHRRNDHGKKVEVVLSPICITRNLVNDGDVGAQRASELLEFGESLEEQLL